MKVVATRCQILGPKCTKFDFSQKPPVGAYSASQTLAVYKGPTSKRMKGRGREDERKGQERKGERRGEGNGRRDTPDFSWTDARPATGASPWTPPVLQTPHPGL